MSTSRSKRTNGILVDDALRLGLCGRHACGASSAAKEATEERSYGCDWVLNDIIKLVDYVTMSLAVSIN